MIAILISLSIWMANKPVFIENVPIQWLNEINFDFGDIAPQVPVQHTFSFKNTSSKPIVIETVRTSCGCTGSTWTETPILPDSTGAVVLEFDAKQSGEFSKYAKVFFEGYRGAQRLTVTGFVVEE